MATLTEVDSEQAFHSVLAGSPSSLIILYFHTPWAAPCTQMREVLQTLASTYPSDNSILFLSINAEDLPDISESYDVTAVPFVVLQRDGKTIDTVSGSDVAKVRAAVENHAGAKPTIPPMLEATPRVNGTKTISETIAPAQPPPKDELWQRLEKLVKAAPVMLFMKGTPSAPQCGFSRQLVTLLRQNEVRYGFFNILADDDVRQGLKEYADWPTFPQLWKDGELVGGLDIVCPNCSVKYHANIPQVKEELDADPDFLRGFSGKNPAPVVTPSQTTAAAA